MPLDRSRTLVVGISSTALFKLKETDDPAYYAQLHERTEGLPPTVFVLATEEISFREVLA